MRILIVEDEISLLKFIAKGLREGGYNIDIAKDGKVGEHFMETIDYDCVILDIMLPFIDGLTLLKKFRIKNIITPVIILTAKDSIEDRVRGLDLGADDYLVKPFSLDELLARLRALLRRKGDSKEPILSIDNLNVDLIRHTVARNGTTIELTAREFTILEYLLRNKGILLTRSQIAEHVWDYDFEYNSNIVDVYIGYLRRKIDDEFKNKLIHTIRGSGYILDDKR
jgi:DNA-binding response OmpR family regulator